MLTCNTEFFFKNKIFLEACKVCFKSLNSMALLTMDFRRLMLDDVEGKQTVKNTKFQER